MGKWCLHASTFIFDRIIIKVAGNQNRHKSSVEFDFGPNQTTHFGVIYPWVTKISHFWSWISLKPVGQSWSNFMYSIIGVGKGCMRFLGRLDQNSGFHGNRKPPLTYNGEKDVSIFSRLFFDPILFILAGNEDMHKISDEFEFRPDRTTDYGVSCPWGLKNSHRLIMGKWCLHASSFIFDWIIIQVAGNQDRHKISDEFDFGPLVSMAHLYVFWNEIWPWHIGLRWATDALWAIWRNRNDDKNMFSLDSNIENWR